MMMPFVGQKLYATRLKIYPSVKPYRLQHFHQSRSITCDIDEILINIGPSFNVHL
jgi:hypothetical protein